MPQDSDVNTLKLFNPNQPRDDHGRWTNSGGASVHQVADRDGFPVDILEEEAKGGHTFKKHVGKSEDYLKNRVRTETYQVGRLVVSLKRAGSFPNLEAATKLTNSTLADNQAEVDAVANGNVSRSFIKKNFGSKTGIEAFSSSSRQLPYMRDTYAVGVGIVHDRTHPRGYRVITSYPMNLD
jgi:Bacterial CdiA-CT RNAse A domain